MAKSEKGSGLPSLLFIFFPFIFLYSQPGLYSGILLCVYQMGLIFIKSTFFNHLSAGDEIWSTAPIMYAYLLSSNSSRNNLQLLLITLWGTRLSYNLWRKGGYRGLEDYRWVTVKNRFKNPIAWKAFHVLFLCIYQMVINFQQVLPLYYTEPGELCEKDYLLTVFALLFIVYQAISDQQQWTFQEHKKSYPNDPISKIGFAHKGLWQFCRHPNYFAELGFWWCIYGFTYNLNWGIAGVLTMTLLFQRVIRLTEAISSKKYPLYKTYQERTPKLIPWPSHPIT